MKHLLACIGLVIAATTVFAQQKAPVSPAVVESATIAGKSITIHYNSPAVKGREGHIYTKDGLISHNPHYPVWRAGANPATTLHTDADLNIGGLKVPAGTYTIFVNIADPDHWLLIVNKKTGEWGLAYDGTQDLGTVKFPTRTTPALVEDLKYTLKDLGGNKGSLTLAWEHKSATIAFRVE